MAHCASYTHCTTIKHFCWPNFLCPAAVRQLVIAEEHNNPLSCIPCELAMWVALIYVLFSYVFFLIVEFSFSFAADDQRHKGNGPSSSALSHPFSLNRTHHTLGCIQSSRASLIIVIQKLYRGFYNIAASQPTMHRRTIVLADWWNGDV